jgi:membrane protease YdiL (CAAX protease family)
LNFKKGNDLNWNSGDAWQCVIALVVCDFLAVHWLRYGERHSFEFWKWIQTLAGTYFTVAVQGIIYLGLIIYFSKIKHFFVFCQKIGLRRGITLFGWYSACVAVVIAIIDGYGTRRGWTASSLRQDTIGHGFSGIQYLLCLIKTVFIVPFYEEAALRGFLYDAFRGSYRVFPSICLIVCFSGYLHWHSITASLYTFACLAALWTLLCIVKERTGSLWDCLLCHAVYNAVGINLWISSILILILILLLLMRSSYLCRETLGNKETY